MSNRAYIDVRNISTRKNPNVFQDIFIFDFECDGYDPHFRPNFPSKLYDTIVCNYVLNVVPEDNRKEIIAQIKSLLKPNGNAFISVRRDMKKDCTTKETEQYVVTLDCVSVVRNSNFEMYQIV